VVAVKPGVGSDSELAVKSPPPATAGGASNAGGWSELMLL
jgi:hypothetical protein